MKPTAKPTSKPWVKPSCEDTHKYCAAWASLDECKKNPSWMLVNCPVACDQCSVKCEDGHVHCQDWADMGECNKNADYMNIYCAKVRLATKTKDFSRKFFVGETLTFSVSF